MKKIAYISALLLLAITANAQEKNDSLVREVNVVRTYIPEIQDAGKINTLPDIEKPEVIPAKNLKYSTWSAPLATSFDLQTLPSATLRKMRAPKEFREGYAKIGAGNYLSFLGDIYVPILKAPDYRLDFATKHLSNFGKVRLDNGQRKKAQDLRNSGQLAFSKSFFKMDLFSEVNFYRHDFNYYGQDLTDLAPALRDSVAPMGKEAHTFFDVSVGVASRDLSADFQYTAAIKYELAHTKTGLNEHHIQTIGNLSYALSEPHLIGVNLSLDNMIYNSPDTLGTLFQNVGDRFTNYTVFGINPYYKLQKDIWDIKLGLKANFASRGKAVSVSPDIAGQVALVPEIFYLYAGLGGDYEVNTLNKTLKENQYVRPDVLRENTRTPLNAYGGLKFKVFNYLIFNGFAGYKFIDNQYFYVNHRSETDSAYYDNTFDIVVDEANLFYAGASLTYNYKQKVSALLKGTYNNWKTTDQTYAWHKPDWELNFDLSYKINDDIRVSANAFALGKRYALGYDNKAVKLKPLFDLSLSGTYEYSSWVSFFLNLNNLLYQNNQIWYGYNLHKFNFMAGATFSF
ncbi:MAG: hypothetical protein LBN27_10320 [Prevotellaceae bacterium]|jgi:hypothetical protein|nr:hypothetical protein [Prevotellaceae bacterium]